MSINSFIKSMMNIMRDDAGIDGTVQTLSQIVWMLFLRVYDKKEEDWELFEEDYESPLEDKYKWRNWVAGEKQNTQLTGHELLDFVNNDLFPKLKGIVVTDITPRRVSILKEMMSEANNYMKDGVCLRKAVNLINGIDFDNYDESHAFNDIYEGLLKYLQAAGKQGEYYTPRALTTWITKMVNPKLGETVADFACGTGGFAVSAIEHIRENIEVPSIKDEEILEDTILCVEKKQLPYMLCTTNLLLHGIADPKVMHGNSLEKNVREYRDKDKVDIILMNPPYGGNEQSSILSNFPADLRNSETADLFMIEILYRLKENGRVGIVLPDGFLFGVDNSKRAIKEKLFKECNVHTIIRLCGSVFAPYTSIATNLIFFDKTGATEETWFYRFDLPEGYKAFSKTRPLTLEHMQVITEWWNNREDIKDEKEDEAMTETWKAKKYSIQEIIDRNYDIDLCGFPIKEDIILSPEETITNFKEKRESLDAMMDKKLAEILTLLGGE